MPKNFGTLATDDNNEKLQSGRSFTSSDATDTPQTSPLAILTASATTIAVPENAAEMVVWCDQDVNISTTSGLTDYFTIPALVIIAMPVSNVDNVYVQGDSADGTLNFFFLTI